MNKHLNKKKKIKSPPHTLKSYNKLSKETRWWPRGSFHKAILATIDLTYLRLILQLPALIFNSIPRNNFKTIVKPAFHQI